MTDPIHISNTPTHRKVTSTVAFILITPIALIAGAVTVWYRVRRKRKD